MPGVQALDLPRTVAFAIWPHQVDLVTNEKDPYFDRRVFEPIDRSDLISVINHGYQQNIKVVQVDGRNIPVFGKGRTKIGLVINHLCGAHPYTGTLKPVLEEIVALKGGAIHDLILDRVGETGVRMMATPMPTKGGAAKAQRLMAVENTHRRAESEAQRAERAQRMLELGVPEEDIMADLDVKTKVTLHKLLKFDPNAPAVPRKKPEKKRPSAKRLTQLLDTMNPGEPLSAQAHDVLVGLRFGLEFARGSLTTDELAEAIPSVARLLKHP